MRRTVLLIMAALFVQGQALAREPIRIAYFNIPPHVIYDTETNRFAGGAVVDLIENYITPETGIQFAWDPLPSTIPRQLTSLETGQVDAVALLVRSPDRAAKYAYTEEPFYSAETAIAVAYENPIVTIETVEDILDMKIGFAARTYISPFMRDKRIRFDLVSSANFTRLNFLKLMAGRIDGFYSPDSCSLLMAIKTMGLSERVRLVYLPEAPSDLHVVFSPKNKELASQYSAAFLRVGGQKKYLEILSTYIDINRLKTPPARSFSTGYN